MGGGSEFGKRGHVAGGIQLGNEAGMKTAFTVMGERRYKDFRRDTKLTMRQFQVAFRELRQYSRKLDLPKTELDIDGTINSTCNQGGYLKLGILTRKKYCKACSLTVVVYVLIVLCVTSFFRLCIKLIILRM